jgi:Iap family predicted aminopeptidase
MEGMKQDMRFMCKDVGVRMYGSPEERRVADYIKEGFEKSGLSTEIQEFPVERMEYTTVEFGKLRGEEIIKLDVLPLAQSGFTENPEGEILELAYLENIKLATKKKEEIQGKAVIVYGGLGEDLKDYRALVNSGAKVLIVNDSRYPVPWLIADGMPYLWMQEKMLPVILPIYFDTVNLLKEGVKKVFVKVAGKKRNLFSQNVVGFREGKGKENIIITAHHDSVMIGEGATDNATGVAILLEIARRLEGCSLKEKNILLVSCGSEEVLSYGSFNFVKNNKDMVKNCMFNINFDSCSSFYGENKILVTGEEKLSSYIKEKVEQSGEWYNLSSDISPFSDQFPFNIMGVPSIWFRRHNSYQGYFPFHSHLNELEIVDFNVMKGVIDMAYEILDDVSSGKDMPFPREISVADKERIDVFHKDLFGDLLKNRAL